MVVVSSLGPPEEGVVHKEMNVTTFINEKRIGKGTLYISEARVTWVGDASAANHTFSLEYNHISVHAISRDAMVFPHTECLYLMIDAKLVDSVPGTPASTPGVAYPLKLRTSLISLDLLNLTDLPNFRTSFSERGIESSFDLGKIFGYKKSCGELSLFYVWFISYSDWRRMSKLLSNFGCLFAFCYSA